MGNNLFTSWQAYYTLEPFGQERADLRAGIVASTMANALRGKRTRAYKPKDFMPMFGLPHGPTEEELLQKVRFANWALGGRVMIAKNRKG